MSEATIRQHVWSNQLHYITVRPGGGVAADDLLFVIPGPSDLFARFSPLEGRVAVVTDEGHLSFEISDEELLGMIDPGAGS